MSLVFGLEHRCPRTALPMSPMRVPAALSGLVIPASTAIWAAILVASEIEAAHRAWGAAEEPNHGTHETEPQSQSGHHQPEDEDQVEGQRLGIGKA